MGTSDGGASFQELGLYDQRGVLTVVLKANSANGTVVADGVGIAPAWASGGGQSAYETEPSYQLAVQSTGYRTNSRRGVRREPTAGMTTLRGT